MSGANTNYYKELDLRYAEIGIAMQKIDRMNPGRVAFSIPILTPNMNNDTKVDNKVVQRDKSNIQNENRDAVDVSNIEVSNYVYIEIPKELCALPGAYYDITGNLNGIENNDGYGTITITGNISIIGNSSTTGNGSTNGNLNFSGTVDGSAIPYGSVAGASFSGDGGVTGQSNISGKHTVNGLARLSGTINAGSNRTNTAIRSVKGTVGLTLNTKSRYIPEKSKWLIMFIGGDISCPVVLCRLPDSAGSPVTEDSLNEPIEYVDIDQNTYDDPFDDFDVPTFDDFDVTTFDI